MEYTRICTEAEAEAIIVRIAEANPKAVSKDLDAILELGTVDSETVWGGYLWDAVEDEIQEMDEDTLDLLLGAIVDYYCDQVASFDEEDF